MATSADQYHNKLQNEVAERAEQSGHSVTGPGAGPHHDETSGLSREPSYVDRSSGSYPQEKQGLGRDSYLQNHSEQLAPGTGGNDVSGITHYLHELQVDREKYPLPQGEQEYAGRDHAQVVDHSRFQGIVGDRKQDYQQELEPQQSVQPGEIYNYGQGQGGQEEQYQQESSRPDIQPSRSYIANTRPQSEYTQVNQPQESAPRSLEKKQSTGGFAGVGSGAGAVAESQPRDSQYTNGETGNVNNQHMQSLQNGANLSSFPSTGAYAQQAQPSQEPRASHYYPTEQLNQNQHYQQPSQEYAQQPAQLNTTDLARKNTTGTTGTAGAIAVGNGPSALSPQQNQSNGYSPREAVSPTPTSPTSANQYGNQPDIRALSSGTSAAAAPIAGGGLGAALASSGHNLDRNDKKALKQEIKTEKTFEKSLVSSAKQEGRSIEDAIKMAKASGKAAEKSGKHELAFRKTYDKAVKDEVKMKQRLLKITSEYNKVAAELEKATKESEIRKNAHQADCETRDADARKVDELRKAKGVHDMERQALHGESLTKQAQAKRALSMKGRPKSSIL